MPLRLRKTETINEAVQRISREQITKAAQQLEQAGCGASHCDEPQPPTSFVHEARKHIKKLRALVRLVRDRVDDNAGKVLGLLRDACRQLSDTRDRQAMVEVLQSLASHAQETGQPVDVAPVLATLTSQRDQESGNTADPNAGIAGAQDQLQQAQAIIEGWSIEPSGFAAIKQGLFKASQQARAAMHAAFDDPTDENLHEWRKRVKIHWYHIRLLRGLWPAMMQAHAQQLGALSDQLGEDHDLSLLAAHLQDPAYTALPQVSQLRDVIEQRRRQLRSQAVETGSRLFAEKPAQLQDRLHGYWRVWRKKKTNLNRTGESAPPDRQLQPAQT